MGQKALPVKALKRAFVKPPAKTGKSGPKQIKMGAKCLQGGDLIETPVIFQILHVFQYKS